MKYSIYTEEQYQGLRLYSKAKAKNGFHLQMLKCLLKLMRHAIQVMEIPKCAHLVIDSPIEGVEKELGRVISRWNQSRHKRKGVQNSEPPESLYFAVKEIRPRTKQRHMHVAIIFDGLNYEDLVILKDKLISLSETREVRIYRRSRVHMREKIIESTGEIVKLGSIYFHSLKIEFDDAFSRMSYLCKVFTKEGGGLIRSHVCSRRKPALID